MMEESEFALLEREVIEAWQCIGCGRIEAPQPCIGVCEDRKARLVDAALYEHGITRLREARREAAALEGLVRRLAMTRPRQGEWERSYMTFQKEAQRALSALSLVRSVASDPTAPDPMLALRGRF
jgi:hypothetical protein